MNELIKDITARELEQISSNITEGVGKIIEQSKGSIAVYLNSKVVLTYWNIGKYIAKEIDLVGEEKSGTKIVATVSQQLAESGMATAIPSDAWAGFALLQVRFTSYMRSSMTRTGISRPG